MRLLVAILFLTTLCCAPEKKPNTNIECVPYFSFDHLDHYHLRIRQSEIRKLMDKPSLTSSETELLSFLQSEDPMTLGDTLVFANLEGVGFKKQRVDNTKYASINELFCSAPIPEELKMDLCLPVFKDALVFRKNNQIVGFVKLCLSGDESMIVGTEEPTHQFGQLGEFEKLMEVLGLDKWEYYDDEHSYLIQ